MGTSGENEVFGGVLFFANGNGVWIDEIGEAFDAGDFGGFVRFLIVATGLDDGFKLTGGNRREIKMKILGF